MRTFNSMYPLVKFNPLTDLLTAVLIALVFVSLAFVPTASASDDASDSITSQVLVLNSQGEPISGLRVRYNYSSWKEAGFTDSNGLVNFSLPASVRNVKVRVNLNDAWQDIQQDVTQNPLFQFRTVAASTLLQSSTGTALPGGDVICGVSSWHKCGVTDASGRTTMELLPVTYRFRMSYEDGQQTITQDLAESPTVLFETVRARVSLLSSAHHGLSGGKVTYTRSSWTALGTTDDSGMAEKELLPGRYRFRMSYRDGQQDIQQDVGLNNSIAFHTLNTQVSLVNVEGKGLEGAKVRYKRSSWTELGTTNVNGIAALELLPSNYTFRMDYKDGQQDLVQNPEDDRAVKFTAIRTRVQLVSSGGNGLAGGKVSYRRSSWKTIGSTPANGVVDEDLLPGSYTFRMQFEEGLVDKNQDIRKSNQVTFTTLNTQVKVENLSGKPVTGAALIWRRSSWISFGMTDAAGLVAREVLPGSYQIRAQFDAKTVTSSLDNHINPVTVMVLDVADPVESFLVHFSVQPSDAGTVAAQPNKTSYNRGDLVALSVLPNTGYEFSHWSGESASALTNNQLIIDGESYLTAVFQESVTDNDDGSDDDTGGAGGDNTGGDEGTVGNDGGAGENTPNPPTATTNDMRLMPAEGGSGKLFNDGANWTYWNKGALFEWNNPGGDYIDAEMVLQGDAPWSSQIVTDTNSTKAIVFDVSTLVSSWLSNTLANRGFFLRNLSGSSGPIDFATKEHENASYHPKLVITTLDLETIELAPQGDTFLTASTKTLTYGQDASMRLRGDINLLTWFDLSSIANTEVLSAQLVLTTTAQYTNSDSVIGIYAIKTGEWDSSDPVLGLAANYDNDEGISSHADVLLHYSFDTPGDSDGASFLDGSADSRHAENIWSCKDQSPSGMAKDGSTLEPAVGIPGLTLSEQGNALCARLKYEPGPANQQGLGNYGMSLRKSALDMTGEEHYDELYVRFYLFLGETWGENILNESGKRPGGISGTYSDSSYAGGWGGRRTTGANGWSARGGYVAQVPYGYNPLQGSTTLATYLYHADQTGGYGDQLKWGLSLNGSIQKGRWYSIEQYVKINTTDGNNQQGTSGNNDGIVRGWVDGRLVFEKTDVRFTDMDYIKIQTADFGLYYGGFGNTPHDQHIAIDDVVISKSYIGPKTPN